MGKNMQREWTMGPILKISLEPSDGIGGVLRVFATLGCNIGIIVGLELGVSLIL